MCIRDRPTTPSALISKPIRLSKKNSLPKKANVNSASAESDWKDCLSTENTALLAVQMIGPAIDSTNAYVPRRLKVASGALLLREGGVGVRFACNAVGKTLSDT